MPEKVSSQSVIHACHCLIRITHQISVRQSSFATSDCSSLLNIKSYSKEKKFTCQSIFRKITVVKKFFIIADL